MIGVVQLILNSLLFYVHNVFETHLFPYFEFHL